MLVTDTQSVLRSFRIARSTLIAPNANNGRRNKPKNSSRSRIRLVRPVFVLCWEERCSGTRIPAAGRTAAVLSGFAGPGYCCRGKGRPETFFPCLFPVMRYVQRKRFAGSEARVNANEKSLQTVQGGSVSVEKREARARRRGFGVKGRMIKGFEQTGQFKEVMKSKRNREGRDEKASGKQARREQKRGSSGTAGGRDEIYGPPSAGPTSCRKQLAWSLTRVSCRPDGHRTAGAIMALKGLGGCTAQSAIARRVREDGRPSRRPAERRSVCMCCARPASNFQLHHGGRLPLTLHARHRWTSAIMTTLLCNLTQTSSTGATGVKIRRSTSRKLLASLRKSV